MSQQHSTVQTKDKIIRHRRTCLVTATAAYNVCGFTRWCTNHLFVEKEEVYGFFQLRGVE